MRDTRAAVDGGSALQHLVQLLDLARRPYPSHLAIVVDDGDAGRVIASVLEPAQALDQDRHHVSFSYCTDDSAHVSGPGHPAGVLFDWLPCMRGVFWFAAPEGRYVICSVTDRKAASL